MQPNLCSALDKILRIENYYKRLVSPIPRRRMQDIANNCQIILDGIASLSTDDSKQVTEFFKRKKELMLHFLDPENTLPQGIHSYSLGDYDLLVPSD
jgi:hypothetical protein